MLSKERSGNSIDLILRNFGKNKSNQKKESGLQVRLSEEKYFDIPRKIILTDQNRSVEELDKFFKKYFKKLGKDFVCS